MAPPLSGVVPGPRVRGISTAESACLEPQDGHNEPVGDPQHCVYLRGGDARAPSAPPVAVSMIFVATTLWLGVEELGETISAPRSVS